MALDPLDTNRERLDLGKKSSNSKSSSNNQKEDIKEVHSENQDKGKPIADITLNGANSEGDLFKPYSINNVVNLKNDILKKGRDDETRSNGPRTQENYVTKSLPSIDPVDPIDHDGTFHESPRRPTFGPALPPDHENDRNDKNDVETPTWIRRFSVLQSATESNRWKDFKQAFKFGKSRKELGSQGQQQQTPVRKSFVDDTEEEARKRASNMITSFLSGSPAALFPASAFQTDEHGTRRAPLLLTMVGIEIEDISKRHSKHRKYKLNLEYGVAPNRLRWTVVKDHRDFVGLHSRLKVALFQSKNFRGQKAVDMPKFPRSHSQRDDGTPGNTLNDKYLSAKLQTNELHNFNLRNQHPDLAPSSAASATSDHHTVNSGRFVHRLQSFVSRASSLDSTEAGDEASVAAYTKKLELYIKQVMLVLALRPQANKLFQFFELSPLGVLLSYEHGYQGKQGYLFVGSSAKAQGWRVGHLKASDFKQMVQRHTNKWFLIRSSYVMYVSDIYSTTPLEIFLVDRDFKITFSGSSERADDIESIYEDDMSLVDAPHGENKALHTHFTIKLENGERQLKLLAKSENQAKLWVKSLETMFKSTVWSKPHRFNSFAPVRENCFAQWFVDGRDYFWAVSSAIEMARDVVYIHDWWLSPELYMRRPANGNQEFRLDRILKRKAEQGVKIFVIIYRNVGSTVVTDSLWTKHSLIDLHPNIHCIRSPNQWLQNTYFWAHHEKLCIIDHTVAFVGGIDLCYGRYDSPDHVLVDDSPHDFANKQNATEDSIKYQKFPGKDYSNPRVKDFFSLDKPYESMYDREAVPRMPWHDVHMMTAGQPATDLARHFVQRWNYLLRQKRPSRPTPLLAPPPEFSEEELERFNLSGTCEVQLLRSAGNWSLGLKETEHSIQDAYLKLIETSEHFVYIENQFFITSSAFDGTVIENRIGDALVDRIIRAHKEKKAWKAVIMIPLMPGFESQVDEAEGSAVRVIMQCQYMSISRGETSIFAKLKKMNINPYEYIQFFSLRKWGRIGPGRKIVSEQLYIHAKILLVDDRVALIGSANINERSQRGNRDSEVAAVVRDTETVNTTMNGQPYKAGRFAHTLRMRLMREHLGIDVDILDAVEARFNKLEALAANVTDSKTNNFQNKEFEVTSSKVELASRDVLNMPGGTKKWKSFNGTNGEPVSKHKSTPLVDAEEPRDFTPQLYQSFNNRAREQNIGIRDKKQYSTDSRLVNNLAHKNDVDGKGSDRMDSKEFKNYKLDAAKTLKKWSKESLVNDTTDIFLPNVDQVLEFLENDTFIGDPQSLTTEEEMILAERNQERWELLKRIAYLQRVAAKQKIENAEENEKLQRMGASNVHTKSSFNLNSSRNDTEGTASSSTNLGHSEPNVNGYQSPDMINHIHELPGDDIPVVSLDSTGISDFISVINDNGTPEKYHKFIDPYSFGDPLIETFYEDVWFDTAVRNTMIFREVFHCQPDDVVATWKDYKDFSRLNTAFNLAQDQEALGRSDHLQKTDAYTSTSHDDSTENSQADISDVRRGSVRAQDINENIKTDGILGQAPPGFPADEDHSSGARAVSGDSSNNQQSRRVRRAFGMKRSRIGAERVFDRETADRLLREIQGHLVLFPVDWLHREIESGNWFYNMDRLPPIEIYD